MKRICIIVVVTFTLICAAILIVNAQFEQGILNEIGNQKLVEDKQYEEEQKAVQLVDLEEDKIEELPNLKQPEIEEKRYTIMLDPGHQENGNNEQEPVSPGAAETKPKVSSGTAGVATNKPEYELTLEVSIILQEALEEKGFDVLLTRSTNQVDVSNVERAQMANEENVDLFLRIHADGAENSEVHGFSVLTPAKGNQSTEKVYDDSLLAAETILSYVEGEISLFQNGLFFRDDLSGFNWSEVPVVLVELGFMSNPQEDKQLSDAAYVLKLTDLLADGIEAYIEEKEK